MAKAEDEAKTRSELNKIEEAIATNNAAIEGLRTKNELLRRKRIQLLWQVRELAPTIFDERETVALLDSHMPIVLPEGSVITVNVWLSEGRIEHLGEILIEKKQEIEYKSAVRSMDIENPHRRWSYSAYTSASLWIEDRTQIQDFFVHNLNAAQLLDSFPIGIDQIERLTVNLGFQPQKPTTATVPKRF